MTKHGCLLLYRDADYGPNINISGALRYQNLGKIALLQHLKSNSGLVSLHLQWFISFQVQQR